MRHEKIRTFLPYTVDEGPGRSLRQQAVEAGWVWDREPHLVLLSDVPASSARDLARYAFLTVETSPGRFECWIAFDADAASATRALDEILRGATARVSEVAEGILAGSPSVQAGSIARVDQASGGRAVAL